MIKEGCIFCEIYEKREGIIYENDFFYAQFDRFPITPGHAEIITNRHVASLLDLTDHEWANLKPTVSEVVKIIEGTNFEELYQRFVDNPLNDISVEFCQQMLTHVGIDKKPDGYNFGNNDGEAAGRTIHHFHFHVIPRYFGDVEDPRGGIRHIIPELGNYKK